MACAEVLLRQNLASTRRVTLTEVSTRKPDVALHILAILPPATVGGEPTTYTGEYIGHGASKTVLLLRAKDQPFHMKVLKVTKVKSSKAKDSEPAVFKTFAGRGLTTSILYEGQAKDEQSGRLLDCWITDYAMPLNVVCKCDLVDKSKCGLAAFCCLLKAAEHGLYLSDCNWYNLGVQLSDDAEDHTVLIIDAGSRKIDSELQWTKGKINDTIMHKFWKACAAEEAPCDSSSTMRVTDEAACSCDSSSV